MFKALSIALIVAAPLAAQERTPSHCHALADATPGIAYMQQAAFGDPLADETVRLTYVAHSRHLLETSGGLSAATDHTGFLGGTDHVPTVATMNHAHDSHWTHAPDPRIPHVLPGWGDGRTPIEHSMDLGEVLIRNVPTHIRTRYGGVALYGNSIFVFEAAGLCIGHLGHLHHEPTPEQYAAIGRLDVVMAAVDGGTTVDTFTMTRILKRLLSSIILPMHWFSGFALNDFLERMSDEFDIVRFDVNSIEVSRDRLPSRPQIIVLQPGNVREQNDDN